MYVTETHTCIELVKLEDVAARLDLTPEHLAKIVLTRLQVHPVRLDSDNYGEWYFWRDVVNALGIVAKAKNGRQPLPLFFR